MNSLTDQQLLRDYAEKRSEAAFAELVRRHIDIVYSAALRMVCDAHLAQDVTQGVFVALAQNARPLAEHPVLSGWLHRTTRNLAANTVRSETRRRTREQEAADMNLLNETQADWETISPHLDEALCQLDETDRDALMLRYFERKSAREMANVLGLSEEAAQKRASRAVEHLREIFSKQRVTIGAGGLAVLISANAVQSAPVALAAAISTAFAGTAIQTSALVTATKTIAMTTLQKSIIVAALASIAATGIYAARQNSVLHSQIQMLQQQKQSPLDTQMGKLQQAYNDATNQLAGLLAENAQLKSSSNESELLRLRGEVTRLGNSQAETGSDPTTSAAKALVARVNQLKQWLEQHPNEKIPELNCLSAQDWIREASFMPDLELDEDFERAFSQIRSEAKQLFAQEYLGKALDNYIAANNGQLPGQISQLGPYLNSPVDPAVLQRYQVLQTGNASNFSENEPLIGEIAPVDEQYDTLFTISAWGYAYKSTGTTPWSGSGNGGFGTNATAPIKPFFK